MNIILIGYRGTGKSTVGKILAKNLGLGFADTDQLIVARVGTTIKEIFARSGEAGFRTIEAAVIAEVTSPTYFRTHEDGLAGGVIAVGGGAILKLENLAAFKRPGNKVVWLSAPPEILAQRIASDQSSADNRPSLTANATSAADLAEIRKVLAVRTPIYQSTADFSLPVGQLSPPQAADQIAQWFHSLGGSPS